jgi:hypothetical protein
MVYTAFARWLHACWLPVFLSVALHGLLGLFLGSLSLRSAAEESEGRVVRNTRICESKRDVALGLWETDGTRQRMPRHLGPELSLAPAAPVVAAPPNEPPSRYAPIVPAFSRQDREDGAAPHPGLPGAERGTGSSGRERGQGITAFFQVVAHGRSVVYVIDRSASMGPSGGLAVAKRELLASLGQLPPETRFQVLAYNRTAAPMPINGHTGLLGASAENKRQAALLIEGLDAEGGTEHLPALKHALALQPDVIYWLTDADDFHIEQVRIVTGLNHGRTVIHAIVLTTGRQQQDEQSLARLAQANRGEYREVSLVGP